MADERTHSRRKRTFSSCSTVSSDDYHDASEQIVEDVTLEFFYKPRSLTALSCLFLFLIYSAFTRNPDATRDENIWSGVVSLIVVFLVLSLLVMPNGPFIRPHPAIWRLVFGCSVLYLMFLSFSLFQTREDFRKILFFFDPELIKAGPDTEEYAVNCSHITVQRLWGVCDIFAFAHFFGWALKAMLIRHAGLCWMASITWEVTEVFFSHLLPNFKECWWDALVLDVLICNGLGIHFGLYVCKKLEMRNYHWESIKDIHSTSGKITRAVMQFTPVSWTHVRWMDPKCSYMRYFAISQLLIVSQVVELNTFFLKHILYIPTRHWLNWSRIFLISLVVAPSLRQYYSYVTDTRSKRVGTQCWVLIAITLMECLICIKYGLALFKKTEMTLIAMWLLFQMLLCMGVLYFMVMTKSKDGKVVKAKIMEKVRFFKKFGRRKELESIPADDPTSKTIHYLVTNGHHMTENGDTANQGASNGHVKSKEAKDLTNGVDYLIPPSPDHGSSRKRKPKQNDGMTTRLRSRKSQAGV
ncbi:phosphatidylserine synthase 1 isoform X2 [Nematostella vectensis]|uniref:phosphatidylserine synthase 1 isoform X2 n=1 Tax=Nematostella vectensis TaxID=45351 RepID=UPI00139044B2|nr:phosphatidylserine synthase 1 isoform X2 [Nematostella vectensis]